MNHTLPLNAPPGVTVELVEMDFATKRRRKIRLSELGPAMREGAFVWLDVDVADLAAGERFLNQLGMLDRDVIHEAVRAAGQSRWARYENCIQDLLADRDILSDSLELYMSMVSHRTNAVMKRLTAVSVIFLPLTFLVGVYGMNFPHMPELTWPHPYPMFWGVVVAIVVVLLVVLRRNRLL